MDGIAKKNLITRGQFMDELKSVSASLFGLSLFFSSAVSLGMGSGPAKQSFYESSPTYRDSVNDTVSWKISQPAAQGMDKAKLETAAADLAKKANLWSFVVVRNDHLIFERYFNGSDRQASNNVHSASKSILSAAVGVAIDRGFIKSMNQSIAELLPNHFKKVADAKKRNITLNHLLTMRSGLQWVEDSTEYQIEKKSDWVQAILDLKLLKTPGLNSSYLYSTGSTHIMSAILAQNTRMSYSAFTQKYIFDKLGVKAERWGVDPQGYNSGGYNLYLTPREMAKFGMLFVNEGRWNGEQLVPREWAIAAQEKQVNARTGFDYGYNWWIRQIGGHKVAFAWGYGGQFIYTIKDLDLVVVITTNTRNFSTEFEADYILSKHVIPAVMR